DVSVQAQIVDLLRELQRKHKLAYLFISHDLKVVRALANSIIVLRHGKVVEQGPARTVFAKPKTDYTKALLAAAFELQARRGRDLVMGTPDVAGRLLRRITPVRSGDTDHARNIVVADRYSDPDHHFALAVRRTALTSASKLLGCRQDAGAAAHQSPQSPLLP